MAHNTTPTQANRGLLPVGTYLCEYSATVIDRSDTAYLLVDGLNDELWLSFDQVHGRPLPVAPLLQLG